MPGRPTSPNPQIADWLEYLGEIGYEEMRLSPGAAGGSSAPVASSNPPNVVCRADSAAAERPPRSPEAASELAALALRAETCVACRLSQGRNRVVFGSGPPSARLMFVGEGPGAEEDKQGLPFVGRAGELLTRIVQAIEMSRDEVYIANIVKCRPPGNREPERDEVDSCIGFLERQIDLVRPEVLVCLGRVAAQTLLGTNEPMSRMRGTWYTLRRVPTMVTYHPAALLRNSALKRPTWEDMQKVRDRLRGLA